MWTGNVKHKCRDILLVNILGTLSNCVSRAAKIQFAKRHLKKLQSMGILRNGVPSEATLCRFDNGTDEEELAKILNKIAGRFSVTTKNGKLKIVSMDGKCTRGTVLENGRCPDIVSAYSVTDRMTIGTEMCEVKSNEIKAVPKLLDNLGIEFKDCVFTADAMSCQKNIIEKIRSKGGHFLIEVKSNQKTLRWGLEDNLQKADCIDTYTETGSLAHGRIESRTCRTYNGEDVVADKEKWGGDLKVLEVNTKTTDKKSKKVAIETRYYITDLDCDARTMNEISRSHWSIETMHWILDCVFLQDKIRRKHKKAARNLDTIQRFCLSIISAWKIIRKKKSDKSVGSAELLRKFNLNFSYLKLFLALK